MSSTETGQLLLSIGEALGRTPEQMAPIIDKLVNEEWYDSIESLRKISESKWALLNLPKRLVDEIKVRIVDNMPQLEPIKPAEARSGEVDLPTKKPDLPDALEEAWQVEIAAPSSSAELLPLIDFLKSEISNDQQFVACLTTLCQIIANLLGDPQENKYRQLKASNAKFSQTVGQWKFAQKILREIGFQNVDDQIFLCPIVYLSRLNDMHFLLASAVEAISAGSRPQLAPAVFNPFRSSIVNAGNTFGAGSAALVKERDSEHDKLRQEVSQVAEPVHFPKPKLVRTAEPKKAPKKSKKKKTNDSEDEDEDDKKLLLSSIRGLMSSNDNSKFQSREKLELEKLKAKKNFHICTIRIVFLDNCYLEMCVKPTESVAGLYQQFINCLKEEYRGDLAWTLTVSPPLRKLERNSRTTMNQEGFVPSVSMRMMKEGKQCTALDVLDKI